MKDYQIESVLKCQYADAIIKSKSHRVIALAIELYKESIEMGSHYGKARLEQLKKDGVIK